MRYIWELDYEETVIRKYNHCGLYIKEIGEKTNIKIKRSNNRELFQIKIIDINIIKEKIVNNFNSTTLC